jgi:hypothetical protein
MEPGVDQTMPASNGDGNATSKAELAPNDWLDFPEQLPHIAPTFQQQQRYERYFILDVCGQQGHDHYVHRAPNGVCVVGLAPSHALLRHVAAGCPGAVQDGSINMPQDSADPVAASPEYLSKASDSKKVGLGTSSKESSMAGPSQLPASGALAPDSSILRPRVLHVSFDVAGRSAELRMPGKNKYAKGGVVLDPHSILCKVTMTPCAANEITGANLSASGSQATSGAAKAAFSAATDIAGEDQQLASTPGVEAAAARNQPPLQAGGTVEVGRGDCQSPAVAAAALVTSANARRRKPATGGTGVWSLRAGCAGKLLQMNQRLVEEPHLLAQRCGE